MENMQYYDDGLNFIERVSKCRLKINSLKEKIDHAHHFLSMNPGNELMTQQLHDDEQELITYQNEEKVQTEALMVLESKIDPDFFKLLLQNLGNVKASTLPFPHVEDNMNDENMLSNAITATAEAIKIKKSEYDTLSPDDYRKVIVASELRYFYNDLAQHSWGRQKLSTLDDLDVVIQQSDKEEVVTERGRA